MYTGPTYVTGKKQKTNIKTSKKQHKTNAHTSLLYIDLPQPLIRNPASSSFRQFHPVCVPSRYRYRHAVAFAVLIGGCSSGCPLSTSLALAPHSTHIELLMYHLVRIIYCILYTIYDYNIYYLFSVWLVPRLRA